MARSSNWNDELIQKLVDLYNEGKYSTKQIGEILGFSKNAIVGKIHRLELNKQKLEPKVTNNSKSNSEVPDNIDAVTPVSTNSNGKQSNYTAVKKVSEDKKVNKLKNYKLEEIEINMCVWPYGESNFTFCGAKVLPTKPYCQEHFEKSYLRFNKKAKKA
ncbi:GcrA family cell cycle regulator [Rickettsiales bacterium LUAb2]